MKAKLKKVRHALPPAETSEQLRARLRKFAMLTRSEATRARTVPFPENVTVLAGPLRRRATAR
ncbi:hypothetical protein [Burkholderia sp. Ac-20365]|uniref:hypothetical protein n=1 Tax=Burkholderia sp. Ac-20365 TaxID=2703897 RepID=UPI00197C2D31|nr:hypothetical protein [Burkholderia sp. Ac-20365]MBN3761025.1 hypothetical protein [Burkholderia sp. Ac-20365]